MRKLVLVIALVALAALLGCQSKDAKPKAETVVGANAKTLSIPVAEFKDRFNEAAKRSGVKLRINNLPTVNNSFRVVFDNALGLAGTLDKPGGNVVDLTAFFPWSDNEDALKTSVVYLVGCSHALIELFSPGLTGEQKNGILRELGMLGKREGAEQRRNVKGEVFTRSVQRGHVKYTFRETLGTAVNFFVEPL